MPAFEKGVSGNPNGRPKGTYDRNYVRDLARQHTETAIACLVGIIEDKAAPPSARTSAAISILDRGWGKPTQPLEAETEGDDVVVITKLQRDAVVAALLPDD